MTPALAWILAALAAAAPAHPKVVAVTDSSAHNLVVLEFGESPPSGLTVTGGLLGVPDSTGGFPVTYQRFDPVTGSRADPGRSAGDALVFTNLRPGTYRVAMLFLGESKLARRLLPKHGESLQDRCLVYGDSIPQLTFTVGEGEFRYLGRLVRHTRPTLENKDELWKTWYEWGPGDERKLVKDLGKRKDLATWKLLLLARGQELEAAEAKAEKP